MKKYMKNILPMAAMALSLGMASCTSDLDVEPINPNLSLDYDVEGLFNKCYANIALAGNGGADGDCGLYKYGKNGVKIYVVGGDDVVDRLTDQHGEPKR